MSSGGESEVSDQRSHRMTSYSVLLLDRCRGERTHARCGTIFYSGDWCVFLYRSILRQKNNEEEERQWVDLRMYLQRDWWGQISALFLPPKTTANQATPSHLSISTTSHLFNITNLSLPQSTSNPNMYSHYVCIFWREISLTDSLQLGNTNYSSPQRGFLSTRMTTPLWPPPKVDVHT